MNSMNFIEPIPPYSIVTIIRGAQEYHFIIPDIEIIYTKSNKWDVYKIPCGSSIARYLQIRKRIPFQRFSSLDNLKKYIEKLDNKGYLQLFDMVSDDEIE